MWLKPTKVKCVEFGPFKLGNLKTGEYKEVEVPPILERLYYNHTRRGAEIEKSVKKRMKKVSVESQIETQSNEAKNHITDGDLDDIFIDNSPQSSQSLPEMTNIYSDIKLLKKLKVELMKRNKTNYADDIEDGIDK